MPRLKARKVIRAKDRDPKKDGPFKELVDEAVSLPLIIPRSIGYGSFITFQDSTICDTHEIVIKSNTDLINGQGFYFACRNCEARVDHLILRDGCLALPASG